MVEPFLLIFESFLRILVKFRKKLNDAVLFSQGWQVSRGSKIT
jgi:hypothetical protein